MGVTIRSPFSDVIGTRDATTDKDSLTTNMFFDVVPEGEAFVKRPGLENLTSALGLGINGALGFGQGIFYYDEKVFSFNSPDIDYFIGNSATNGSRILFITQPVTDATLPSYVIIIDENDNIIRSRLPDENLTDPVIFGWKSLLWTGTYFCLLGQTGDASLDPKYVILRSIDGETWTEVATDVLPTSGGRFYGAAINSTACVFVDTFITEVYTSTDDGATWTRTELSVNANPEIANLHSNTNSLSTGQYSTTDGLTWTPSTGNYPTSPEFITNLGTSYYVYDGGYRYTSTNGIAWTRFAITGDSPDATDPVTFGDGLTVTSIINYSPYPQRDYGKSTQSSNAGLVWSFGQKQFSAQLVTLALYYVNGKYYALSYAPGNVYYGMPYEIHYISTSTDGITWQSSSIELALFNSTPTIISGLV